MLGISAMASFSDAHENPELPIIAANLHRVMQPRQSQIWCVIRQKDTLKRIVYSVAGTMLGRMCLSGDVTDLSAEQWKAIDDGVAFYKKAAPIIRDGQTYWFGNTGASYRHPTGWQGILRCGEDDRALCVFHRFQEAETEQMLVQLPDSGYQILQEPVEISIQSTEGMGENRIPASVTVDGVKAKLEEFVLTDESYIVHDQNFASGIVQTVQQQGEIRSENAQAVLEITNHRKFLLPQTGGAGSYLITIAGLAVAAAGVFAAEKAFAKRRKQDGNA